MNSHYNKKNKKNKNKTIYNKWDNIYIKLITFWKKKKKNIYIYIYFIPYKNNY